LLIGQPAASDGAGRSHLTAFGVGAKRENPGQSWKVHMSARRTNEDVLHWLEQMFDSDVPSRIWALWSMGGGRQKATQNR